VKEIVSTIALVCVGLAAIAHAEQRSETAAAEQELFRYTNQARAQAGAPPLEWNQWLAQAAREHAQSMVARGELSHQVPGEPALRERLIATGLRFDASAENIAFGDTPSEIHQSWMKSPGHRTNLLNPRYNAIGIVVMRRGDSLWAVEDFAHTVPQLSATDVEDAVAAALDHMSAQDHLQHMKRVEAPQLRKAACDMAHRDQVQGAAAFGAVNFLKSAVAFTEADPRHFETQLGKSRKSGPFAGYTVGACFARTPTYPEGTNFVLVGFF